MAARIVRSGEVAEAFRRRFGHPPDLVVRAPGRVTLLGAHVDSCGGPVLPAAIDRAVWVAASPTAADRLEIVARDFGRQGAVDLARLPPPLPKRPGGATPWVDVPLAVAWTLQQHGHLPAGLRALVTGDLPRGSGLSSSAATAVAFLLVWEAFAGWSLDGRERARLCQQAENGYLGVRSGAMDPFASLHGRAGHFVLLDTESLEHHPVAAPRELALVVVDSGVRRRLTESGFNDRRRELDAALGAARAHFPQLSSLRRLTAEQLAELRLSGAPGRRARHVVEECDRVERGAAALAAGELESFGRLVRRSHESSRDLFEVSRPELDLLAETAWAVPGCYGARLMGGGFGGWVAALCEPAVIAGLTATLGEAFARRYGRSPESFSSPLAEGARRLPS